MDLYIYLDESGHLHKNSRKTFFSVGCVITTCCDKDKIKRAFKNLTRKLRKNILLIH